MLAVSNSSSKRCQLMIHIKTYSKQRGYKILIQLIRSETKASKFKYTIVTCAIYLGMGHKISGACSMCSFTYENFKISKKYILHNNYFKT